jgi:hypothetical protein
VWRRQRRRRKKEALIKIMLICNYCSTVLCKKRHSKAKTLGCVL